MTNPALPPSPALPTKGPNAPGLNQVQHFESRTLLAYVSDNPFTEHGRRVVVHGPLEVFCLDAQEAANLHAWLGTALAVTP